MRNANAKSLVWISEKTNAYSGYGKTIASVIVKKGEAVSENRGNGNTQNFLGLLVLIPEKLATPQEGFLGNALTHEKTSNLLCKLKADS